MTSISYGGGPSIEARRSFSNLKEGSQVPGYRGYIHQLKYNEGHTYGDQTHILANTNPPNPESRSLSNSNIERHTSADLKKSNLLPNITGLHKLNQSVIPGYTGYIPSRKFKFSNTYKTECNESIDNFLSERSKKIEKESTIMNFVKTQEKHVPICKPDEMRSVLNNFANNELNSFISDKRSLVEPPIPGYTGYVPKIKPTEYGLGARYHETTKSALNRFASDLSLSASSSNWHSANYENGSNDRIQSAPNRRIFKSIGMVPKYTGYIHGRKFEFGNTYGNTTRELPVCTHTLPNFGLYMDKEPPKTVIC